MGTVLKFGLLEQPFGKQNFSDGPKVLTAFGLNISGETYQFYGEAGNILLGLPNTNNSLLRHSTVSGL